MGLENYRPKIHYIMKIMPIKFLISVGMVTRSFDIFFLDLRTKDPTSLTYMKFSKMLDFNLMEFKK